MEKSIDPGFPTQGIHPRVIADPMNMKANFCGVWFCLGRLVLVATVGRVDAREPKESDKDVQYDEARLPEYDLPPALLTVAGTRVESVDEWNAVRRPEILGIFANLIYGRVPEAADPLRQVYEVAAVDREFMEGKAVRKDVRIRLSNKYGQKEIYFVLMTPRGVEKPVPVFLVHSFNNTQSNDFEASPDRPGTLRCGWPVGEILDRGYGIAAVYHQDLVGHNEVSFLNSIHRLFYPDGQSFPKAHEWGVIAACSWGASRAMDYLETDPDVDSSRVIVMEIGRAHV